MMYAADGFHLQIANDSCQENVTRQRSEDAPIYIVYILQGIDNVAPQRQLHVIYDMEIQKQHRKYETTWIGVPIPFSSKLRDVHIERR